MSKKKEKWKPSEVSKKVAKISESTGLSGALIYYAMKFGIKL